MESGKKARAYSYIIDRSVKYNTLDIEEFLEHPQMFKYFAKKHRLNLQLLANLFRPPSNYFTYLQFAYVSLKTIMFDLQSKEY